MQRPSNRVIAGGSAGAVCVLAASLIAPWEGLWTTAKPDRLARDLPTVCYGMTPHDRPVKIGDKYTPAQCMEFLVADIPKYLSHIQPCVRVKLTNHQWAALVSASYNAGGAAVCKSSMVRKFNEGDSVGGCNAFRGWYIRSAGIVRKGLINRRNSERDFCMKKD